MTERKHFKQLVRSRMAKTGENYSSARRQIMRREPDPSPGTSFPNHFPGSMPVPTALRVLLAGAGIRNPETKSPFSEAMVFGFTGGIGAGVFAFHYATENLSSFYVAGRHEWWDDVHWGQSALERLGLRFVVKESAGAKPGEKHLRELLAGGRPVMAWGDAATLPYRGLPASWSGGGYHAVAIHGIDDATGMALVADLADEPIHLPLADLAAARGRIKKFKNRLLALEPAGKARPLAQVVRESIAACADSLTSCKMKNYTLQSFAIWADKLDGSKAADSWEKRFPRGPLLFQGLWSITEFIDFHGTGGGLCRPMFAEFLEESSQALGDRGLLALAERYADLGRDWSALAEAALPEPVPVLRKTRELLRDKWEVLHTEGERAGPAIAACWNTIQETAAGMKKEFPLSDTQCVALRKDLKQRVRAIYEKEVAGLEALRDWAG